MARFSRLLLAAGLTICLTGCDGPTDAELEQIGTTLGLQPGTMLADIGTGDGDYLPFYASAVGADGIVYATEIDAALLEGLRNRIDREELRNVEVRAATATASGLEVACCDAIVMRNVYHHLSDPEPTLLDIHRALRPGGRLLIIDFQPTALLAPWTPDDLPEDRGGHGIAPGIVIREAAAAGFHLVSRDEAWAGGHVLMEPFAVLLEKRD